MFENIRFNASSPTPTVTLLCCGSYSFKKNIEQLKSTGLL